MTAAKNIKIAVLGAGNMGTAVAHALARNEHDIWLWDFFPEVIEDIRRTQINQRFLPGVQLHERIRTTLSQNQCVANAELVIIGVPSPFSVLTITPALPDLAQNAILLNVAKGFAPGCRQPLPFTLSELAPHHRVVHLAGPTLASELARGVPSSVLLASKENGAASQVADWFSGPSFIPTTTTDLTGASLSGIIKNVYAILLGYLGKLCDESCNLEAVTTLACMREMIEIATAHGAKKETLYGLAGLGDFVATGFSHHSHNRTFGQMLGNGDSLVELEEKLNWLPEGARSTTATCSLAREKNIRAPFAEIVHQLLEGEPVSFEYFLTVLRHESSSARNFHFP